MDFTNQPPPSTNAHTLSADLLRRCIAEQSEALLGVITSYVRKRLKTASSQQVHDIAAETLNEMVVQALYAPDRFDPTRQPRAWLLKIAYHLVLQRAERIEREREHEYSSRPAYPNETDIEIFDRLAERARQLHGANQASAVLQELLARITPEERDLVERVDLQGWNYATLAPIMGVSEMTLRKRHFRAIERLRQLASQKGGQHS